MPAIAISVISSLARANTTTSQLAQLSNTTAISFAALPLVAAENCSSGRCCSLCADGHEEKKHEGHTCLHAYSRGFESAQHIARRPPRTPTSICDHGQRALSEPQD